MFFGESKELNASFYAGIAMVVLSVVLQTMRAARRRGQTAG